MPLDVQAPPTPAAAWMFSCFASATMLPLKRCCSGRRRRLTTERRQRGAAPPLLPPQPNAARSACPPGRHYLMPPSPAARKVPNAAASRCWWEEPARHWSGFSRSRGHWRLHPPLRKRGAWTTVKAVNRFWWPAATPPWRRRWPWPAAGSADAPGDRCLKTVPRVLSPEHRSAAMLNSSYPLGFRLGVFEGSASPSRQPGRPARSSVTTLVEQLELDLINNGHGDEDVRLPAEPEEGNS